MKRITALLLLFISIGCSKDDNNSVVEANELIIDGTLFEIKKNADNTDFVTTNFQANVNDGQANSRFFSFENNQSSNEILQLEIIYPTTQTTINGSYTLELLPLDLNNYAQCAYTVGINFFTSVSGTVKVTDKGNNKFKLEFIDAVLIDENGVQKQITGSYEGTFLEEN